MEWFRLFRSILKKMSPLLLAMTLALVFKGMQLDYLQAATSSLRRPWRIYYPELAFHLGLIAGSLWLVPRLPQSFHPAFYGLLTLFLWLQTAIAGLDVISVHERCSPLHYLELRQFMLDPAEIGPVVDSVLDEELKRNLGLLAMATTVAFAMAGIISARPTAPAPSVSMRIILPLFAFAVMGYTVRLSVKQPHAMLQTPTIERLAYGIWVDLEQPPPLRPEDLPPPLTVERPVSQTPANIVLVILESTGYFATSLPLEPSASPPNPTPVLSKLAREGVHVPLTYSSASHTSKALVGILCGQLPYPDVRVIEAQGALLSPCLPSLLEQGGYSTAFFQAPRLEFEHRRELAQAFGFQTIVGGTQLDTTGFEKVNYFGYEDRIVLEPIRSWLRDNPNPYFLTVLTATTHHPYGYPGAPKSKKSDSVELAKLRYQRSLGYVDAFVEALLALIEKERSLNNTLVLLIGDHGEAFGEHGPRYHDWVPYEEVTRVPWILWGPDVLFGNGLEFSLRPGSRIDGLRHHIDLVPTVLDFLGWTPTPSSLPGQSLLSASGHTSVLTFCWSSNRCLSRRQNDLKYVQHDWGKAPEVFDLQQDPGEQHDLASTMNPSSQKEITAELWAARQQLIALYRRRQEESSFKNR